MAPFHTDTHIKEIRMVVKHGNWQPCLIIIRRNKHSGKHVNEKNEISDKQYETITAWNRLPGIVEIDLAFNISQWKPVCELLDCTISTLLWKISRTFCCWNFV